MKLYFGNYSADCKNHYPEHENRRSSATGAIIARAVVWFKGENDSESVRLWKKIAAISLAIFLAVSIVGIFYLIEGIYFWEKRTASSLGSDNIKTNQASCSIERDLSEKEQKGTKNQNVPDDDYFSSWSYEDTEDATSCDDQIFQEVISQMPTTTVELDSSLSGDDILYAKEKSEKEQKGTMIQDVSDDDGSYEDKEDAASCDNQTIQEIISQIPTPSAALESSSSGDDTLLAKEKNEISNDPDLNYTPKPELLFKKVDAISKYQVTKQDDALNYMLSDFLFDSSKIFYKQSGKTCNWKSSKDIKKSQYSENTKIEISPNLPSSMHTISCKFCTNIKELTEKSFQSTSPFDFTIFKPYNDYMLLPTIPIK